MTYVPSPVDFKILGDTAKKAVEAVNDWRRGMSERELRQHRQALLEAQTDAQRALTEETRARVRALDESTANKAAQTRLTDAHAVKKVADAHLVEATALRKEAETNLINAQADKTRAEASVLNLETDKVRAQLFADVCDRVSKLVSLDIPQTAIADKRHEGEK
jgi:HPt (histidine-containing phosphotransfer) domain-containing protein